MIENAKYNFYKEQIKNADKNIKKIWDAIDQATNLNKNKSNKIRCIETADGELVYDEVAIANTLNNYFPDVGSKLAENIPSGYTAEIPRMKYIRDSVFLAPTSKNEMIKLIHELNNTNFTGPDGISCKILKQFHSFFLDPLLVHIVNRASDVHW